MESISVSPILEKTKGWGVRVLKGYLFLIHHIQFWAYSLQPGTCNADHTRRHDYVTCAWSSLSLDLIFKGTGWYHSAGPAAAYHGAAYTCTLYWSVCNKAMQQSISILGLSLFHTILILFIHNTSLPVSKCSNIFIPCTVSSWKGVSKVHQNFRGPATCSWHFIGVIKLRACPGGRLGYYGLGAKSKAKIIPVL